ncbi:MAG: DNA mismatch repair endonuclease MutL [Firmicutes bacterium]|nr:DNA mismatch repair endonuclease MutL [Bacillota bacterium]
MSKTVGKSPGRAGVMVLPEAVADLIAAGEVVERPASVVKELVENAIDAGAARIDIRIEGAGLRTIEVQDDGCGMDPSDVVMALRRHATSKIHSAGDLLTLRTLGFRGEALPSIASVSVLELTTRPREALAGTFLSARGGAVEEVRETGCPPGTMVTVKDLFYNTPARLAFLKSKGTELAHLAETAGQLALAHPGIAVSLSHEGRTLWRTPGNGRLETAIPAVFHGGRREDLRPARWFEAGILVYGLIGLPQAASSRRNRQIFFVNGRPVRSPVLYRAVDDGYRALSARGLHPTAILNLELDPSLVDVNVHPSKLEVKFREGVDVFGVLRRAVAAALRGETRLQDDLPGVSPPPPPDIPHPLPGSAGLHSRENRPILSPTAVTAGEGLFYQSGRPARSGGSRDDDRVRETAPGLEGEGVREIGELTLPGPQAVSPQTGLPEPSLPEQTGHPWRSAPCDPAALKEAVVLGQAGDDHYIVVFTAQDLLLVDQHVAHERILFDQMMEDYTSRGNCPVQELLVPLALEVTPGILDFIEESTVVLEAAGFRVEPFGFRSVLFRSVPVSLGPSPDARTVLDIFLAASEAGAGVEKGDLTWALFSELACRGAVKGGARLAFSEAEQLLRKLSSTADPFFCPHGRPIVLGVSWRRINRSFGRS